MMRIIRSDKRGITLVEIMLLLAILFLIASWFVRIFYAREYLEWENGIYSAIGIDPDFARFVLGAVVIVTMAIIAVKRSRARRRKKLY